VILIIGAEGDSGTDLLGLRGWWANPVKDTDHRTANPSAQMKCPVLAFIGPDIVLGVSTRSCNLEALLQVIHAAYANGIL